MALSFLPLPQAVWLVFCAAVLGACTGSFCCCLASRQVHGQSALRGRSRCDACGHTLGAGDLIPVLSWLMRGGRCRYCGAALSVRYPATELCAAVAFAAVFVRYGITPAALEGWLFCAALLCCACADLEAWVIPHRYLLFAAGVRLVSVLTGAGIAGKWYDILPGAIAVPGALLALVLLMERLKGQEMMGGGDIKLLAVTGLYLGWRGNILCLLLACLFGIAAGIAGRAGEKPIPWGPSIAAAAALTLVGGDAVLGWYFGLFGLL